MKLFINGSLVQADMQDSLTRALIISLFSWRRADDSDDYDHELGKQGWWGDSFNEDEIGSKLWQLLRSKITSETLLRAQEMADDALQWLVEDGICTEISVSVERDSNDPNRINLSVILEQEQGKTSYEIKDVLNGND